MEKYFNINERGCSVKCKLYYSDIKSIKRAVVCGHGFSGHKDNKAAQRFADYVLKKHRDIALITYNSPCHGDDVKKKLTLDDCALYIELVTDYAKKHFKTDELYVYATSFGGYLFLKYIAEHGNPYRKIALRCPAVNMYEVFSSGIVKPEELKALSRNKPIAVGFDRKIKVTRDFLNELKENDIAVNDYTAFSDNILILHGTKDEIVSFDYVRRFSEDNSIGFIPVENADHRFTDPNTMNVAVKAIYEFFEF